MAAKPTAEFVGWVTIDSLLALIDPQFNSEMGADGNRYAARRVDELLGDDQTWTVTNSLTCSAKRRVQRGLFPAAPG